MKVTGSDVEKADAIVDNVASTYDFDLQCVLNEDISQALAEERDAEYHRIVKIIEHVSTACSSVAFQRDVLSSIRPKG